MKNRLKEILNLTNGIGKRVSDEIQVDFDNTRLKVAFDLLKKTACNINVLCEIDSVEKSETSKNIIYRSVFSDLMLLAFLQHVNDNQFEHSLNVLNATHVKFMADALPMRLRLGRQIFNPGKGNNIKDINEIDLLDEYYDYFHEYISSEKGDKWIVKKYTPPKDFIFSGQTRQIYDYFEKCTEEVYRPLSHLYMYYRVLSQTEHYSFIGKSFAFKGANEEKWYGEYNVFIENSLELIGSLIARNIK